MYLFKKEVLTKNGIVLQDSKTFEDKNCAIEYMVYYSKQFERIEKKHLKGVSSSSDYTTFFHNRKKVVYRHYKFAYIFTDKSITVSSSDGTAVIYSVCEIDGRSL